MQIFILNICLASFRKEDILFNSIENMKMKTSIGLFYKNREDFTRRVSDCEELVG